MIFFLYPPRLDLSLAYILVVGLLLVRIQAVFRPTDIAIAVIAVYLNCSYYGGPGITLAAIADRPLPGRCWALSACEVYSQSR